MLERVTVSATRVRLGRPVRRSAEIGARWTRIAWIEAAADVKISRHVRVRYTQDEFGASCVTWYRGLREFKYPERYFDS